MSPTITSASAVAAAARAAAQAASNSGEAAQKKCDTTLHYVLTLFCFRARTDMLSRVVPLAAPGLMVPAPVMATARMPTVNVGPAKSDAAAHAIIAAAAAVAAANSARSAVANATRRNAEMGIDLPVLENPAMLQADTSLHDQSVHN